MIYTRQPISTAAPYRLDDVKGRARVDHDDEDAGIAIMAETAAAEIERHCELALLAQTITVTFRAWCKRIPLPVGPLYAAGDPLTVELIDDTGTATPHPAGWWIEGDRYPVLNLTTTTNATALRIVYLAGYGLDVDSIPADLQLAISDHAARLYDLRGADDAAQGLSLAASRIAARHRRVAV
ncbi:hypothetical protein [Palleronia sp.]|uniref:head-tail connector protein n=1 Tax=Palleronia sp. TaxID=1940284 RepID=UPI0035C78FD2